MCMYVYTQYKALVVNRRCIKELEAVLGAPIVDEAIRAIDCTPRLTRQSIYWGSSGRIPLEECQPCGKHCESPFEIPAKTHKDF
jgi:hypothetical protein